MCPLLKQIYVKGKSLSHSKLHFIKLRNSTTKTDLKKIEYHSTTKWHSGCKNSRKAHHNVQFRSKVWGPRHQQKIKIYSSAAPRPGICLYIVLAKHACVHLRTWFQPECPGYETKIKNRGTFGPQTFDCDCTNNSDKFTLPVAWKVSESCARTLIHQVSTQNASSLDGPVIVGEDFNLATEIHNFTW